MTPKYVFLFPVNFHCYNNNINDINDNRYLQLFEYIFFSYLFSENETQDLYFTGNISTLLFIIIIIIKNTIVLKTMLAVVRQGIQHLIYRYAIQFNQNSREHLLTIKYSIFLSSGCAIRISNMKATCGKGQRKKNSQRLPHRCVHTPFLLSFQYYNLPPSSL